MGPVLVRLLVLSCFLFLSALAPAAAADAGPVLDSEGNEVKRGVGYYILPINETQGGGLGFRPRKPRKGQLCPLMSVLKGVNSQPVMFDNKYSGFKPLTMGADVSIGFSIYTVCMRSMVWFLGPTDPFTHRSYVRVGAPFAPPVNRVFRIERFQPGEGGGYKIAFCPPAGAADGESSGAGRGALCPDLGLFVEDGLGWLGVGGSPFPVVFKKADIIT